MVFTLLSEGSRDKRIQQQTFDSERCNLLKSKYLKSYQQY